jgi:hypothetical protein
VYYGNYFFREEIAMMSGWIAFTVVATASIGMIAAGIQAYTKWLELQIAKSKSDKPEGVNASAEKKSDTRKKLRWLMPVSVLLPVLFVLWTLIEFGITKVSIFFVFVNSVILSFELAAILDVYIIRHLVDAFRTPAALPDKNSVQISD